MTAPNSLLGAGHRRPLRQSRPKQWLRLITATVVLMVAMLATQGVARANDITATRWVRARTGCTGGHWLTRRARTPCCVDEIWLESVCGTCFSTATTATCGSPSPKTSSYHCRAAAATRGAGAHTTCHATHAAATAARVSAAHTGARDCPGGAVRPFSYALTLIDSLDTLAVRARPVARARVRRRARALPDVRRLTRYPITMHPGHGQRERVPPGGRPDRD